MIWKIGIGKIYYWDKQNVEKLDSIYGMTDGVDKIS